MKTQTFYKGFTIEVISDGIGKHAALGHHYVNPYFYSYTNRSWEYAMGQVKRQIDWHYEWQYDVLKNVVLAIEDES